MRTELNKSFMCHKQENTPSLHPIQRRQVSSPLLNLKQECVLKKNLTRNILNSSLLEECIQNHYLDYNQQSHNAIEFLTVFIYVGY